MFGANGQCASDGIYLGIKLWFDAGFGALQIWLCYSWASFAWGSFAWAQQSVETPEIFPLVEEFCYRCHGSQTQTAGINLSALVTQLPLVKNRDTWNRVIDALEVGKMPPAGAPQPPDEVRETMVAVLGDAIHNFDYSTIDNPGFERMRRLTHEEFDNTIGDLFGVDLNVTERFPSELIGASGLRIPLIRFFCSRP